MIAADLIHTIVAPQTEGLIRLAAIVAIRTVISVFLNRELKDMHNCHAPGA